MAELDLYLGVAPVRRAARALARAARRRRRPRARSRPRRSRSSSGSLLEVAAFASQPSVDRIEERNLFYVAPLALIALVGLAADGVVDAPAPRRSSRPRPSPACCRSSSRSRASSPRARSPTRSRCCRGGGCRTTGSTLDQVRWAALGVALAAARAVRLLPRRYALVLPALVAAYFVADGVRGRERPPRDPPGLRSARAGPGSASRTPTGSTAPSAATRRSRTLDGTARRDVRDLGERVLQPQLRAGLRDRRRPAARPAARDRRRRAAPTAALVDATATPSAPQYVLADGSTDVEGRVVARDPGVGARALPGRRPARASSAHVDRPLPERHLVGQDRHLPARRLRRRHGSPSRLGSDPVALHDGRRPWSRAEHGAVVGRARDRARRRRRR